MIDTVQLELAILVWPGTRLHFTKQAAVSEFGPPPRTGAVITFDSSAGESGRTEACRTDVKSNALHVSLVDVEAEPPVEDVMGRMSSLGWRLRRAEPARHATPVHV